MEGDIVLDMVNHFDQEAVAFPCDDPRPREQPVNSDSAFCLAVWSHFVIWSAKDWKN